jgi:predicted phage terminase large subunit-like protein
LNELSKLSRRELALRLAIEQHNLTFSQWYQLRKPTDYGFPRHIKYLCDIVDKVIRGELQNVAISMPPGHGKSQTITTRLPVYWGQRHPKDAIVFTGYSQDFADRNLSRPARELADELGVLDASSNAMSEWRLTNGARLVARGVGSAPTGINPISLLICDDPIKDRAQAESQIERSNIWDWWTGSVVQRFYPRTKAFVIATRWHHDDLIGRLQQQSDQNWTFINLPAIAEENDALGRQPGEALWPEVKPLEFLENVRQQMGEYNFQALFQGHPSVREGAIFKVDRFVYIDAADLPPMVELVRKWDVAASSGKGDWTAGVLLGKDAAGRIYILDAQRFQHSTDERNARMLATARADGEQVRIVVPEDPGSAGKDAALNFIRLFGGYNIKAVRETGSKELRADGLAAQVNAGNVALVRGPWNAAFIEELRQFPTGKNDDQVDAAAGAYNELFKTKNVWDW